MRLQAITSGILAIAAVIAILQPQKVIVNIAKIVKHVAQTFVLWVFAYLIFVRSAIAFFHSVTSYQPLTPVKWVGRHIALQQCLTCLPTGKNIIALFDIICQGKKTKGASIPLHAKAWSPLPEEVMESRLYNFHL